MSKQKKRAKKTQGPSIRKDLRVQNEAPVESSNWAKKLSWPIVIVMCIVVFFLLVHGSNYERRKGFLTFDESIYVRLGFYLKEGKPYNTQEIYEDQKKRGRHLPDYVNRKVFKHPPMFPWLISMFYSALEQKSNYPYEELYGAASKVPNLMGCLMILLVFMFAKKYYGYSTGFLVAFLMAIDLNMTLSSQKVWMESTLTVFMFATLYLLYKACEEHKGYFYAAAITFGMALLTKYTAVLVGPILITYVLIYHRRLLKQKELYIFFAIAGVFLIPWIKHNMGVYGMDTFNMMVLKQSGRATKMFWFAAYGAAAIAVVGAMIFVYKKTHKTPEGTDEAHKRHPLFPKLAVVAMACFICFMFLQKPFLTSILKSLSWGEVPNAGWDMQIFKKEPWYFYLKQHIEYSPIYLFLFVAFLRAPFGQRQDIFLLVTCGWILLFTIVWSNYQGRYALSLIPPALILISSTIVLIFKWMLTQRNKFSYVGLGLSAMVMLYFICKALRVYNAIALNDNVAYF